MSSWAVEFADSVLTEELPKIEDAAQKRILKDTEAKLSSGPALYGKPLRNKTPGYWNIKVGNHRIVYKLNVEKKTATVTHIAKVIS